MRDDEVIALVAVVFFFMLPIGWLFLHYASKTIKSCFEIRLKRDMVARGFTAQEIVQVVKDRVALPSPYADHGIPPAKPIKSPAYN